MIEKSEKLIITFDTTTAAMAMEKLCKEQNLPGRLIPVPREITAGCGMAWMAPPDSKDAIAAAARLASLKPAGFHILTI